MFHFIITKEVPVTILQAYMSLLRHIRKDVLIGRNIASHLCTGSWLPAISQRIEKKYQTRIMFERNYLFFPHRLLCYRCVIFSKQYFD